MRILSKRKQAEIVERIIATNEMVFKNLEVGTPADVIGQIADNLATIAGMVGDANSIAKDGRVCLPNGDWAYDRIRRILALGFIEFLDDNRPEGKMCVSNMECMDIEKSFRNQDWINLVMYLDKYIRPTKDETAH